MVQKAFQRFLIEKIAFGNNFSNFKLCRKFYTFLHSEKTARDKCLSFCDKAMAFCFYALIFAVPISTALVEWFATLPFVFFLLKRFRAFLLFQKEKGYNWQFSERTRIFLKSFQLVSTPIDLFIFFWVLLNLISILVSGQHGVGWKAFGGKVMQNVFVYWLFIECMMSSKRLLICLAVLLSSLFLISFNGIYQHFMDFDFIRQSSMAHGRISSSLREPTDFAAYLVIVTPVVFSIIFSGLFGKEGSHRLILNINQHRLKLLYIFLCIIFIMAVVANGWAYSRAGWGMLFLGLACVAFYRRVKGLWFLVISGIILGVFIYFMNKERWGINISEILSPTGRAIYWLEAVNMIKDHPVFGVGLNAYSLRGREYKISWGGYPHNCYLHMAAEIGITGLCVFLGLLVHLFKQVFYALKAMTDGIHVTVLVGLTAGFTGFLAHSFFDTFFYSAQLGTFMWLMMGWIMALTLHKDMISKST